MTRAKRTVIEVTTKVGAYLADHPGATITEVAFACGLSISEARVGMATASPSETVSETPTKPKRPRTPAPTLAPVSVDPGRPSEDAEWLAGLFRSKLILDVDGAAEYLGVSRMAVDAAVAHKRLSCVQLNHKKLFARADLDRYRSLRGIGRRSKLASGGQVYEV